MISSDYHALPRASSTSLKVLMQKTPAHYYAQFVDQRREPIEPTAAMRFGSLWHKMIFEFEDFDSEYIVVPEGIDRRSKEGKALFASIEESGKEPVTHNDYLLADKMRYAAYNNTGVNCLLNLHGESERTFLWTDERTGMQCKARMDRIIFPCAEFPHGAVIDGKTCQSASMEEFGKTVWNMGYHFQAAFYVDAFQREFKTDEPPVFLWIAQEKTAPYLPAIRRATQQQIEYGREQYMEALDLLSFCHKCVDYPGYSEMIEDQELPACAQRQIDGVDEKIEFEYVTEEVK